MKLQKTANGKQTIKMSKSEWLGIGKTAGWLDGYNMTPQESGIVDELKSRGYNAEKQVDGSWDVWKIGDDSNQAYYENFQDLMNNLEYPV